MNGPLKIDPKGLYPLQPFTAGFGAQLPVYTSPQTWEDVVKHDPLGIINSLYGAVDRAMATDRADKSTIEFRAWLPPEGAKRKSTRVFLSATLYQMTESDQVWIELKKVRRVRSKHGRLAA